MGSSSAPVWRALASAGAMTLRHNSRCSRMISPMLLKSRSASTCGREAGVCVGTAPSPRRHSQTQVASRPHRPPAHLAEQP